MKNIGFLHNMMNYIQQILFEALFGQIHKKMKNTHYDKHIYLL